MCVAETFRIFSSETISPPKADLGKLRYAIARAVWKKLSSRLPEVVLSLLRPCLVGSLVFMGLYKCSMQLPRMCLRRSDLIPIIRNLWVNPSSKNNFELIISNVQAARKFLGWTNWTHFKVWGTPHKSIDWLQRSLAFSSFHSSWPPSRQFEGSKRQDLRGVIDTPVDTRTLDKILRTLKVTSVALSGLFCVEDSDQLSSSTRQSLSQALSMLFRN